MQIYTHICIVCIYTCALNLSFFGIEASKQIAFVQQASVMWFLPGENKPVPHGGEMLEGNARGQARR